MATFNSVAEMFMASFCMVESYMWNTVLITDLLPWLAEDTSITRYEMIGKYQLLSTDTEWADHPEFISSDWQEEVSNGNTRLS